MRGLTRLWPLFKGFEDDDALVYDMSLWSVQKEALVIERVIYNKFVSRGGQE